MGCTTSKVEPSVEYPRFKLVIAGHKQAGKTSVARRIVDGIYDGSSDPTAKVEITSVFWRNQLPPKKEMFLEVHSLAQKIHFDHSEVRFGIYRKKSFAICQLILCDADAVVLCYRRSRARCS